MEKRCKELERERQFGHDRLMGIMGGALHITTAEPSGAEFIIRIPIDAQTGEK